MTTIKPSVMCEQRPDGSRVWQVTRYDAVKSLLTDHRLSGSLPALETPGLDADPKAYQILMRMAAAGKRSIATDQEDRVFRRRILNKLFAGANVVRVKPLIHPMAEQLVDELRSGPQPADLSSSFSAPLCAQTMNELIGVPREDTHRFRAWIEEASTSGAQKPGAGLRQLGLYITKLFAERKQNSRPGDIITELLQSQHLGDDRHERRVLNVLVWMLGIGWQSPSPAVDYAIFLLLTNPGQLLLLRKEPARLPARWRKRYACTTRSHPTTAWPCATPSRILSSRERLSGLVSRSCSISGPPTGIQPSSRTPENSMLPVIQIRIWASAMGCTRAILPRSPGL
jgi:cytochrome P450